MRLLFFLVLIVNLFHCNAQQNLERRINLIIDADTANEVDDLFAIASALLEPKFNLLGITAAQFHISPLASDSSVWESHKLNEDIVKLMGKEDVPLFVGSNQPISHPDSSQSSEATQFIIDQVKLLDDDDRLHIVILGPCTNVASAIIKEPSIISKLSVHYIGFWHTPETNMYNKTEFNSGNDIKAVNLLLDTEGLDFNVMSATTCQELVFRKEVAFRHLQGKKGIGQYLVDRWNSYQRWFNKEDPQKLDWIMWDVAIIEALANPNLATKRIFKTPEDNFQRDIEIYTSIDKVAMELQFWSKIDSHLN